MQDPVIHPFILTIFIIINAISLREQTLYKRSRSISPVPLFGRGKAGQLNKNKKKIFNEINNMVYV